MVRKMQDDCTQIDLSSQVKENLSIERIVDSVIVLHHAVPEPQTQYGLLPTPLFINGLYLNILPQAVY
jgi:hypothetical protein